MKNIAINPEDYTILAVDDIATNIMLLKAVLSRAKYKIVTASGGNEALEKAATDPRPAMRILPGRPHGMGAGAQRAPQQAALHPLLFSLHEPQCFPRGIVPGDPPRKGCLGESPQSLTDF